MNKIAPAFLAFIALISFLPAAIGQVNEMTETGGGQPDYLVVRVDNLVIETSGLVNASNQLSQSIDRLSASFEQLSLNNQAFSTEEKEIMLGAARSVEKAGAAIEQLALELPLTVANLSETMPALIDRSRAPIAELSGGLKSASASVVTIAESLPQATENAKEVINSALNSALIRVILFAILLFALFALVMVLVVRYIYRTYFEPVASKLEALAQAPAHLDSLSRHMKETSDNLIALKGAREKSAQ